MSGLTYTQDQISAEILKFALDHVAMQQLELQDTPVSDQEIIGLLRTTSWEDDTKASFMPEPNSCRNTVLSDWMTSRLLSLGYDATQDIFIDPHYQSIYADFMQQNWWKPDVRADLSALAETEKESVLIDDLFIRPLLTKYNIKARNIYYIVPKNSDQSLYTRLVTLEE